jgi:membrane protein YdbS with pleckstrin-like domain
MAARARRATSNATSFPRRPHWAMRWVWFWRWMGYTALIYGFFMIPLLISLIGAVAEGVRPSPLGIIFAVGFLLGIPLLSATWALIWSDLALARYSWEIRDEDVVVQRGVIFRTRTLIPLRRVQDILVRSGPLLRRWGLSSIKLQTAGVGTHAAAWGEGQLPGVLNGEALAAALLERVKRLRGDV